ncbi:hypothetical protein [Luteibacter sp.]|uniref:hypothetical protein n=1 Tax=Luteibacter sp. TaxID=1886636 RepID=UPI0025BF584B|nr:hypothetical protein [Luteibacter sp.]
MRDEAELKEWEAKVSVLKGSAHSQNALPCPDCGTMLVLKDGVLVHAAPLAKGTEDDLARLPEYEKALHLLQSAVANDKRDLAEADAAAKAIAELEAAVGSAPDEAEIHAARKHLDDLKAERSDITAKLTGQQDAERQAKQADERATKALAAHESVLAWIAIADALAPDGIPGEMLAEALTPLNEPLTDAAEISEWADVTVTRDMQVLAGGRPYALLSESEKWRADAMLAEAHYPPLQDQGAGARPPRRARPERPRRPDRVAGHPRPGRRDQHRPDLRHAQGAAPDLAPNHRRPLA